jgi:hypothetical protein
MEGKGGKGAIAGGQVPGNRRVLVGARLYVSAQGQQGQKEISKSFDGR